ncbi:type III-A CRISPR-associated RAMP protein Csm4 [Caldivirga sp.]|jgi:CRISPR-associated protein Csm4|uniref:type III-A CRISPR-associated RAMP protein Csm4 n=1 Tax=Caldivirga sp. TaxID=2080243 RepID=UPI003D09FD7E
MQIGFIIIRFNEPFRVGFSGLFDTLNYIPSDTIYSALDNLRFMGIEHGITQVSSAYPMIYGDVKVFPIPMDLKLKLVKYYAQEPTKLKFIKRIQYIPLDCVYSGIDKPITDGNHTAIECGGRKWVFKASFGQYISIQRNVVSRALGNADPYRVMAFIPTVDYIIYFRQNDVVDVNDAKRTFSLVGELGIGGERSAGFGHFKVVDVGTIDYRVESGKYMLLLGTALPRREILNGCLNTMVKGWVCSPFYIIGPMSVLTDGSVIPNGVEFENLKTGTCIKRLSPMWMPYETHHDC